MVLTRGRYDIAVKGSSGFVCDVRRYPGCAEHQEAATDRDLRICYMLSIRGDLSGAGGCCYRRLQVIAALIAASPSSC